MYRESFQGGERLSDVVDFAAELEERERVWAVTQRKAVPTRTGKCRACGAPLSLPQALDCDDDCREDYMRLASAAIRAGRTVTG